MAQGGDLDQPLKHATLVALDDTLLLVGGVTVKDGAFSNALYRLESPEPGRVWWKQVTYQDNATLPPVYRHSVVPYTVNGTDRVLLCGGITLHQSTSSYNSTKNVFELALNQSTGEAILTRLDPMPVGLFGHSLAAGPDSTVIVSGGLSGALASSIPPSAALPARLQGVMNVGSLAANNSLQPVASVYRFTRTTHGGRWERLGPMPRGVAFHTSWVSGSRLYVYGGAQSNYTTDGNSSSSTTSGSDSTASVPYGLQVYQLPASDSLGGNASYDLTAVLEVQKAWDVLQPGALSGAATLLTAGPSNTASSSSSGGSAAESVTTLWLVGGWATPQPLPPTADVYLSPQDSSLTWRWLSSSAAGGGGGVAGGWCAPVSGAMAPRAGGLGGSRAVAVTVGPSRKLLVAGGAAPGGWTGYGMDNTTTLLASAFTFAPDVNLGSLGTAYHLHDLWLLDQQTGSAEQVWLHKPSTDDSGSGPARMPFGSAASPLALGPLWDRRLLEAPAGAGTAPGAGSSAVYMQTQEVMSAVGRRGGSVLQHGIWQLVLAPLTLTDAEGSPVTVTAATWHLLDSNSTTDAAAPCYPRMLYGAAFLTSALSGAASTAYLAVTNGLAMRVMSGAGGALDLRPSDTTCLLELAYNASAGTVASARWLVQPPYGKGSAPEARYRLACAARPGLVSYSMTCYGGILANGSSTSAGFFPLGAPPALADAWTFSLGTGATATSMHFGQWTVASQDFAAVRPGPRVEHVLVSLRGMNTSDFTADARQPRAQNSGPIKSLSSTFSSGLLNASEYSPLLLIGGAVRSDALRSAYRRDLWLMDAAGCPDANALGAPAPPDAPNTPRASQLWLGVQPSSPDEFTAAAMAVEPGLDQPEAWVVAAATAVKSEAGLEVWVVLEAANVSGVHQLAFVKVVSPPQGCLSAAVRPTCTSMSYLSSAMSYDDVAPLCWPGASSTQSRVAVSLQGGGGAASNALPLASTVGLLVQDADGVGVHIKPGLTNPPYYYEISVIGGPADPSSSDYTIQAYGKPFVTIDKPRPLSANVTIPFTINKLKAQVMLAGRPVSNDDTELRVLYRGLYYRRGCRDNQDGMSCDTAPTDADGWVTYDVFPTTPSDLVNVSYLLRINTANLSYAAVLQAPNANSPGTVNVSGGINVTLLPDGSGSAGGSSNSPPIMAYQINLPRQTVAINLVFKTEQGAAVQMNANSDARWVAYFFRASSQDTLLYKFNGSFSSTDPGTPKQLQVLPGRYYLQVYSDQVCSPPIYEDSDLLVTNSSEPVSVVIPMSTIALSATFRRVLWQTGLPWAAAPKASRVIAELYVPDDVVQPDLPFSACNNLWDRALLDANFSVIPGQKYTVRLYYPPTVSRMPYVLTDQTNFTVTAPPPTPRGDTGDYANVTLQLNQTLLCNPEAGPTVINSQKGRLPTGDPGTVVYASGMVCTWSIFTGQPVVNLWINVSGLATGDQLVLFFDKKSNLPDPIRLNHSEAIYYGRVATTNLTIQFSANHDGLVGTGFVVGWEGTAAPAAMPPQFIMMIAASSAAAGAMLLFLCLWHCVFRPVQLRRQQAAAAQAAAASAAAAAGAAAGGARQAGGSRNRVPRRYLRMMETSLYSVKDAALAKGAAVAAAAAAAAETAGATATGRAAGPGTQAEGLGTKGSNSLGSKGGTGEPEGTPANDLAPRKPPAASNTDTTGSEPVVADGCPSPKGPSTAPGGPAPRTGTGTGGGWPTLAPAPAPAPSSPPSSGAPAGSERDSTSDPRPGEAGTLGGSPDGSGGPDGGEVCAICLSEFEDGERIKHLPCKHFYHVACIDQWLGRDITCPLCKDNVLDAMRTLFGPLPARNSAGRGQQQPQQQQPQQQLLQTGTQTDAEAGTALREDAGGRGGAAAVGGGGAGAPGSGARGLAGAQDRADLEMVVIVPHPPGDDGGRPGGGGSVGAGGGPPPPSAFARGMPSSPRLPGSPGSFGDTAAPAAASSGATDAGAGGGGGGLRAPSQTMGRESRELRPMRRNISHDLAPDAEDTSTDTESDSGSEATAVTATAPNPTGPRAAPPAAAPAPPLGNPTAPRRSTLSARAFRSPSQSSASRAAAASGGGGTGNQLASPGRPGGPSPASASASPAAAASPGRPGDGAGPGYLETGPSVSPRPVVEHVQHSPSSSTNGSSALRWISGGGAVVVPLPRLPLSTSLPVPPSGLAAGGHASRASSHSHQHSNSPRLPRAQEAQRAAAAAAVSAAAAGVNNGGGAGSHSTIFRTASSTSAGGAPDTAAAFVWSPPQVAAMVAAAVAAETSFTAAAPPSLPGYSYPPQPPADAGPPHATVLNYRIHDNPLARNSRRYSPLGGESARGDILSGAPSASSSIPGEDGPRPAAAAAAPAAQVFGSPRGSKGSASGGGGGAGSGSGPAGPVLVQPYRSASTQSVSVLTSGGSPMRPTLGSTSSGESGRLGGAGGGTPAGGGGRGGGPMGPLAVPELADSGEDPLVRVPARPPP